MHVGSTTAGGTGGSSSDGMVGRTPARGPKGLRTRTGAVIAGLLALVLGAGVAAAVEPITGRSLGEVLAVEPEPEPSASATSAPADCDQPAADLPAAWERAKVCGHEIESLADEDRSEYLTTYGTPEGLVREVTSIAAIRSRAADGSWTDIDTSVVPGDDGRLEVTAPGLAGISFADPSAPDADPDAPLAVLTRDGHELVFDVPFELTEPVVTGDRVTYAGILGDPGISLTVRPNGDGTGIREVITVDDAESAANPGLKELDFRVEVSSGLRLSAEAGGYVAVDESGEQVFRAPQPVGWTGAGHEPGVAEPAGASSSTSKNSLVEKTSRKGAKEKNADPKAEYVANGPGRFDAIFDLDTDVQLGDPAGAQGKGRGAQAATVRVAPDQEVLTDPDTVYPIALDPSTDGSLNEFTAVKSAWPTSTSGYGFEDTTDGTHGIGLCNAGDPYGWECMGTTSLHRIMYEFDGLTKVRDLDAVDVQSAEFNVYGTHSYNCEPHAVAAYQMSGGISTATNWGNMPSWLDGNRQDSVNIAHRLGMEGCSRKNVGFNVTEAMKDVAGSNLSLVTFGLKVNEASMAYWKRYAGRQVEYGGVWSSRPAELSVVYNRPPNVASGLETRTYDPSKDWGCKASEWAPWLPAHRPVLRAKASDPDGQDVRVRFLIQRVSDQVTKWEAWTSSQTSGRVHSARPADTSTLVDGVEYRWRAQVKDAAGRSGSVSRWCYFYGDTGRPNTPKIYKVDDPAEWWEAVYPDCSAGATGCQETGGVGKTGRFRIVTNGSNDVDRFEFSWRTETYSEERTPASDGRATFTYTPDKPGPVTVYARSVDHAGNVSERASYKIDVAYPLADGMWQMDEGQGTKAYDSSVSALSGGAAHPLTLSSTGVTWLEGPHTEFDSRDGDTALRFAGAGSAVADGPVVGTRDSFVVSAFAMPSDLDGASAPGVTQVAVAQEGAVGSGFMLGIRECTMAAGMCWNFSMYNADGAGAVRAVSNVPVEQGRWAHLLAEHDAAARTIRLWVCPVGMAHDPEPGNPVATDAVPFTSTWSSVSPFVVGRGRWGSANFGHWWGRVDSVRVWDGEVVAEAKIRRLCQGAGGDDFVGDVAVDPTNNIELDE